MTTWINVNKQVVARNAKMKTNEPPIRVSKGKYGKPVYCHELKINGPCEMVYNADTPILPCGARLALKTESEVEVIK